jgi:hypothetical protein
MSTGSSDYPHLTEAIIQMSVPWQTYRQFFTTYSENSSPDTSGFR